MWHELMASMSLVRKVLRFFRSIAVLRALRAVIPSDMSKMDSVLFFNILAKFCLANYFFWDHFSFAHKVGAWKPKDQKLVTLTGQLAEGSWLAEIVLTLIENLIRLQKLSSVDPSPAVDTARNAALRSIFRNLCDAPLACHFLGIEPFNLIHMDILVCLVRHRVQSVYGRCGHRYWSPHHQRHAHMSRKHNINTNGSGVCAATYQPHTCEPTLHCSSSHLQACSMTHPASPSAINACAAMSILDYWRT